MIKEAIGIVVALVWLLSSGQACDASELIGIVVPPLPYGIFEDGAWCMGRTELNPCERSISILKTSAGRDFLIYTASAEPMQGNKARWRITDTLAFPTVPNGAEFVGGECRKLGVGDASIVAIVRKDSKSEWLRAHDWAFRIEYDTGNFVRLDPKDIDCANPALDGED